MQNMGGRDRNRAKVKQLRGIVFTELGKLGAGGEKYDRFFFACFTVALSCLTVHLKCLNNC